MAGSTHNPNYRLFLDVLRSARKDRAISQVELADRLGNTQTFVSKCERGERRVDLVEFVEFAEAMECAPEALLSQYLERRAFQASTRKKAARRRGAQKAR